ncbi:MAG TPA: enoyl-CoA hydratase/isomerase family protein [Acidimicrobiia bacterium]|nr:enoyl-CoA hydratase/isomerase family protein [Acidimicrobiia bacterium]
MSGERVGDVVLVEEPGDSGVSPGTGVVLRATIDRPEARNAISPSVVDGLEAAVRRARDVDARVLVIRGAGGTFSAGADLAFVLSTIDQPGAIEDGGAFASVIRRLNDVLDEIEAAPFASVAVVDGFALAGGCEILLACDVVVADEAARIGDRHLELGLLPGGGGSVRLYRALSPARARWLLLSGEMISGREAAEWGLVTRAVPRGELDGAAEAMVARLASRSGDALAGAKEMIAAVRDVPVADGLAAEQRIFLDHMAKSEDVRAALARFLGPKER